MSRKEYQLNQIDENNLFQDPFLFFADWFNAAIKNCKFEANAFVLSTCSNNLQPSARVLLLKSFTNNRFTFASNYLSKKGQELELNQKACMLFYWPEMERQVRIEGLVEKAEAKISDAIFAERPKGSQLGALASKQSQVVESRAVLDSSYSQCERQFSNQEIKRPDYWGAYQLSPVYFEFWQGRENRMHDRIAYQKQNLTWKIFRLAP